MKRSIHDTTKTTVTLPVAARTGTLNGSEIDLAEGDSAQFQVAIGAWTDGVHDITFEERELTTDSWTAVAEEDLDADSGVLEADGITLKISDATKDDTVPQVGYIGGKRYTRAVATVAGTTTGAVYGVLAQQSGLRTVGQNPMITRW